MGLGSLVHFLVRLAMHQSVRPETFGIIAAELALVATPAIFYARHTIAALSRSRAELREMSRRLAIAVDQAEQSSRA